MSRHGRSPADKSKASSIRIWQQGGGEYIFGMQLIKFETSIIISPSVISSFITSDFNVITYFLPINIAKGTCKYM
jgi:hypothetical protein